MKQAFTALLALLAVSIARPTTPHPAAPRRAVMETYMSINGAKQGQFRGLTRKAGSRETEGWFKVLSFEVASGGQTSAPQRSAQSRQIGPLTVTKEVDGASPRLLQAMNDHESLSVILQTLDERRQPIRTITLTKAMVSGINHNGSTEKISLMYEAISFHVAPKAR
jgi:type VI secretion system Hcp family effector